MKKFVSVLLAMMLVLTACAAMAEEGTMRPVPSKTCADVCRVGGVYALDGTEIDADFMINIVDMTEPMVEEFGNIWQTLQTAGKTLVDHFPVELQEQMAEYLPENYDMSNLVAYEIHGMETVNYKEAYGDVVALVDLAVTYEPGTVMTVLAGFPTAEGGMEWFCQKAEATEEGVEVTFTKDLLIRMENEPAMVVWASEPVAE